MIMNEIILRSVYGKVNQKYYIQPCPNPRTGQYPACVKTVNSHGDMILSEQEVALMASGEKHYIPADSIFIIEDGTSFNLDDVVEKAKWEAIEHCNWIAKDRFQRDFEGNLIIDGNAKKYGVADLYVERPGEVTKARVTRKQLVHKACDYVYNDTDFNQIKKAKVLGRDLAKAPLADVVDFLIETAEKDPKKIIEMYEGEDWRMHLFILDAIDAMVIRKKDNLYSYEDKMLGGSINAVIEFLRNVQNRKILDSIKVETYPSLLSNREISELEKTATDNIPHFDKSQEPESSVTDMGVLIPTKKTPNKGK